MSLRPRDRIAIGALAVLALVGLFYMLALKPEHQKVKTLNTEIATQQQAIVQAQQQVATGQAAVVSLRASEAQWAAVRLAVPAEADIPALLRLLERTTDAERVTIQSITLSGSSGGATGAGSGTTSGTSSTGSTSSNSAATPVPVQLSFTGSFGALDSLIQRLEGLVTTSDGQIRATGPLMNISSVQLSGSPNLSAQISASIYQLPTSSASAGTATTTAQQ